MRTAGRVCPVTGATATLQCRVVSCPVASRTLNKSKNIARTPPPMIDCLALQAGDWLTSLPALSLSTATFFNRLVPIRGSRSRPASVAASRSIFEIETGASRSSPADANWKRSFWGQRAAAPKVCPYACARPRPALYKINIIIAVTNKVSRAACPASICFAIRRPLYELEQASWPASPSH